MLMVREPIPIGKINEMYGLPEAKVKELSLSERHLNRCVEAMRSVLYPSYLPR